MILTVGEPAWVDHDGALKGRPSSEEDRALNPGVATSGHRHYPQLLSPLKIGRLVLRNRIISGPLERNLCDRHGRPGLDYERNIEVRAAGGAALIVPEATFVSPEGRGSVRQMGCHHDDFIPDLRRLSEAAHRGGALISMQLNFAGRQAQSKDNLLRPVSASGLPCTAFAVRDVPQILDKARIDGIVDQFADAARRAKEAGFDMIELHGAHGYLLGEFLSPLTNRRDDEYGGPLANRARLALRVYDAVLAAVGADFPISYRISAEEMPGAGLSFDDVLAFSAMLQDRGLAMLSVSAGTYEARGKVVPMSDLPTALNAPLAEKLKAALDVPVAVAGRINDPSDAEAVLRRSQADVVVMTRALHADPALPAKTMSGRVAEILPCINCLYCADTREAAKPSACSVNPRTSRERLYAPLVGTSGRRVAVIGGGMAGMQAAARAAEDGAEVTLFEAGDALGGQLNAAGSLPLMHDFPGVVPHFEHRFRMLGVDVRLGRRATAQDLRETRAKNVVVATGARPYIPELPGLSDMPFMTYEDFRLQQVTGPTYVLGTTVEALAMGLLVGQAGHSVTFFEAGPAVVAAAQGRLARRLLSDLQALPEVTFRLRTTLEQIDMDGVQTQCDGQTKQEDLPWALIVAAGRRSSRRSAEALERELPGRNFHYVGDCQAVGTIGEAAVAGYDVVERLMARA